MTVEGCCLGECSQLNSWKTQRMATNASVCSIASCYSRLLFFPPSSPHLSKLLFFTPLRLQLRCTGLRLHSSLNSNLNFPHPLARSPTSLPPQAMFTGIVEEMGTISNLGPLHHGGFEMTILASLALDGLQLGDSIAIDGTCLTVTRFDTDSFTVGLSPETLRKTSLGELVSGSQVNLERSLQPQSRMGGHFVQGHVDGTGIIVSMDPEGDSLWVKVRTSAEIMRYVVPKGFIAVDGTSLTVVNVFDDENAFNFMLVAYTQQKVVIPNKKVGSKVNLEVDILGKYVERLVVRQNM